MRHLSLDQLADRLAVAAKQVQVGGVYEHYKKLTYTVTGLVIIEATNEVGVVYRANYDERLTFVRELSIWQETVMVEGKELPRFRAIV